MAFCAPQPAAQVLVAASEDQAPAAASFSDLPDEVSRMVQRRREKCDLATAAAAAARHASPDSRPLHPTLCPQVLALVASIGLTHTRDVASFTATSKRCAAVCRAAPLRLAVSAPPGASPREEQAAARAELHALCASFPGERGQSGLCMPGR